MVRDYSPRRSHPTEDPDRRPRTSKSSRRDYDDSPRREGRYPGRERRRDDRDREEPRYSRGRDDHDRNRDYSSRRDKEGRDRDRDRDRDRGKDRDDRDLRDRDSERRKDAPRDGPSRRSASPPRRSVSRPKSRASRSKSPEDKAKPNFNPSGLLAAATKTVEHKDGTKTVLKYHEPPEARKPTVGWRLYVFKGQEQLDVLHIQRQSCYLVGRDRLVVDIVVEHPSCSKQHAAIQFRQVHERNEFGDSKSAVKPFVIDLESTNGTAVNGETIPTSRYFELKMGDVIKFGESQREYVLLSEDAA
ncbi:FHA domain-containing protein [Phanerochaete sordida]|uniref:FHA domain-containing protein n=1 Tax=Phanerochaete sordida TaxID=48140 RepID=A0A9P3G5M1_9APHY|nr:FHA domain-containing protein [Phanerochaete sordida]